MNPSIQGIVHIFGKEYASRETRIESYNFLHIFIEKQHKDWEQAPNTEIIVESLKKELGKLSNQKLAFLLCHTGFIPETYLPDSSQETLYSKLVETVVLAWALRLGFDKSYLPTQKASKEDIAILDDKFVIVCDAKSFRLGRSQAAPNVKDVLKHADISKWLDEYDAQARLGGLVTLPSQHDWKQGSDFYQYTTDKETPTVALYYHHMAFMLLFGIDKLKIAEFYRRYPEIFPQKLSKSEGNKTHYYNALEQYLLTTETGEWPKFANVAENIIRECTFHTTLQLTTYLRELKERIEKHYLTINDIKALQKKAAKLDYSLKAIGLAKQLDRIKKFRSTASGYYD